MTDWVTGLQTVSALESRSPPSIFIASSLTTVQLNIDLNWRMKDDCDWCENPPKWLKSMRSQLHKSTSVSKTLVSTGVWIIVLIWFPWDSHHMTSIIITMTMTIKQQLTFYRQWLYNLRSWPNSRSHWIEFTGSLLNRRLSFEIDNDWLTDYSFMKFSESIKSTDVNKFKYHSFGIINIISIFSLAAWQCEWSNNH